MFILTLFFILPVYYAYIYDENIAIQAINLSQASYCVSSTNYWNCSTCDSFIKLEYIIENQGVRAIQGYNDNTNTLFISFRGSSDIQNWIDNIRIHKVSPYNNNTIKVEKGFYKEYKAVQKKLIDNLSILKNKYGTNEIFVTGHSSGAALAILMTYDILVNFNNYKIYSLINFGSPRVGNQDFVDSFNSFNSKSFRVTHYFDMVPHVPEQLLGYNHVANEIWYNENNSQYKICDDLNNNEDNTCSNSCSPFHCVSTNDHLNYLNITMGNSDGYSC